MENSQISNARPQALKLVDVTTSAQKKNGTARWYDPIADMYYASYASGYVRRAPGHSKEGHMYTINKRISGEPGPSYELLKNPEDREDFMLKAVTDYRKSSRRENIKTDTTGIGPVERVLLNQLNMQAMLVIELERILAEHKVPVNHNHLYQMDVPDLIASIAAFDNK